MKTPRHSSKITCASTPFYDKNVLLPNGDFTVCCADLNSKGVIGNINNDNLYDIYRKSQRLEMIKKFIQGKKHEIDLCKDCETF